MNWPMHWYTSHGMGHVPLFSDSHTMKIISSKVSIALYPGTGGVGCTEKRGRLSLVTGWDHCICIMYKYSIMQ